MGEQLLEEQRENWGSRAGFVLAAIGSAVGLGNLWGFPYKVYSYGGGAFLIPYVIAMVVIGIPLLILEISLGHMTQRAAPDAYRSINRRIEPIGWWGIILGFVIITYYPVILAWCGSYLLECIKGIWHHGGELAWKGQGIEGVTKHFDRYLHIWPADTPPDVKPWSLGELVGPIVISLAVIWAVMYLCICRGVRLVSKVVMLTVPLPWIMLLILTIRGLTLPGAARGLNYFLDPDFSELAKPATWQWAFGQMFFSMSLAFGVMITYASFLHRKSDINNNATIIGLADIGTSFMAGIAVFATLGAMAFATEQAGQAVRVEGVVTGGPGLVFVAFPYALAQLPLSAWFGAVFFIALLTLGIDSAFSITESVLASLVDKTRWKRGRTLIGMTLVGFGLGLFYCTRSGLQWLGTIDGFINDPGGGIVLLGLLECVVVGWAYRLVRLRDHANERSDWKLGAWWDLVIRYAAPLLLSALFAWSILENAAGPGGLLYDKWGDGATLQTPALVGLMIAIAAPILAIVLSFVHSPGADSHGQHIGQTRLGRTRGTIGTLLLVAAIVLLGTGFWMTLTARQADHTGQGLSVLERTCTIAGVEISQPIAVTAAAAIAAVLGMAFGVSVVDSAERRRFRPSGLARLAAGGGVMAVGASGGVLLSMLFLMHKLAAGAPATAAAAERPELDHLTGPAYVMLAAMLAILVVGLAWCFYRAIKATGGASQAQLPEGTEQAD